MDNPSPDSDAWPRIKELLADALELEPEARAAFLDSACKGDHDLRAELESLLPKEEDEQEFLAHPVAELLDAPAPEPGARIGSYVLGRLLGEGGMGRVFEATQEHPHRTVALKILRPGFLAQDAERRFSWEVEALGRLNHAAIARVHDAGIETTAEGHRLSWFAMERVRGLPLLEAADTFGFNREQRLELFVHICEGVAHAHQRGVIHRDLKPDNILVEEDGRPHILDFGIARTADPLASSLTVAGQIVGTLAYMSPEQLLGEPGRVDIRSDVYSLGVLLFRLLTGAPPIDLEGLPLPLAALRLSNEDPRRAGQIDRGLRGDLETILAKALAREPERRYANVDALCDDVRRVLIDEPITARPPNAWYYFTKYTRRHRGLVAGLALAFLATVGAVAGTGIGFVRAQAARAKAEEDRDRARRVLMLVDRIFASVDPDVDGRNVLVVDLLDDAGRDLRDNTSLEPGVRGPLHLTLGNSYRALSLYEPAREHLQAAADLLARSDGELADRTIEAKSALCEVLATLGQIPEAREAARWVTTAVAKRESAPNWMRMRPLELQAALADASTDVASSEISYRRVFEGWMGLMPEGSDAVETARNNYAAALLASDHPQEAYELLREGIRIASQTLGANHENVLTQRLNLIQALTDLGRPSEAVDQYVDLLSAALETWGPRHEKTRAIQNNRAVALEKLGRLDEALLIYRGLLETCMEIYGSDHPETIRARNNLAVLLMRLERFEEARDELELCLDALGGQATELPMLHLRIEMGLASVLENLGLLSEALPVSQRVVESLEELAGEDHMQTLIARNNEAMLLMNLGETDHAAELALRNQRLAEAANPGHPNNMFPFRMNLGRILAADGRFEEAEPYLLEVEAALGASESPILSQLARVHEVLEGFYTDWGKPAQAARWSATED